MVSLRERKEPPSREKVGSPGMVVSLGELIEPPNGDKMDSSRRVVSPKRHYGRRHGMMMSLGIKCSIAGKEKWGFFRQYKGFFLVRGRGWGLGSSLFLRVRCGSSQ
jgi:hypothetical protein